MIADVWESLRNDEGNRTGVVMRRVMPTAKIDLFAGMRKPRNVPMLVIEAPTKSVPLTFPASDASGFSLVFAPKAPGPEGTVSIELELLDLGGEPVFMALVDDVLARVGGAPTAREAAQELAHVLAKWQTFFRIHGFRGLTREQQQGLFGELVFLRTRLAVAGGAALAVKAWSGPSGSNQDFEYSGRAFEVKTTAGNPLTAIRVSNLRQLDSQGISSLHLVVVEVNRLENGPDTLPNEVEATRSLVLSAAPEAAFDFAERLVMYGYLDRHASHYAGTGYGIRAIRTFEVRDEFPRLIEADVPNGVGDVRYAVALSAITEFEIDPDAIAHQMGEWFGDLG